MNTIKNVPEKKAYIYLGPNLPGGKLQTGSVYKGELPKHVNSLFDKIPELQELFVEINDAPHFKKDIMTKGTEAERLYHSVSIAVREGTK